MGTNKKDCRQFALETYKYLVNSGRVRDIAKASDAIIADMKLNGYNHKEIRTGLIAVGYSIEAINEELSSSKGTKTF